MKFDVIEQQSLPENEEKILAFWKNADIFKQSLKIRETAPYFVFYDGPPFATGLPHYGHLLASTIKDVIPRYKTMKGFYVPRRFGWDCHGLPIESEIEKEFNLSGGISIEEFGIAHFNEECRKIVFRYTEEWKETVLRFGRWVEFDNTYHTQDLTFMESVWWIFKQLYEKGLVYEGYKVMPFSAKLGTPLSNFEAGLNYKEVDDPSVTVSLKLRDDPNTSLLVWTTTPWTLISNLAATVGPDLDYVKMQDKASGSNYILAKARLKTYFKNEEEYSILETFKGTKLKGVRYQPLFNYFENLKGNAFRVILGDFVTTEDGTGIVHTAPGFGEDDFYACKEEGIDPVCPVDNNGCFTEEIAEYKGQFVKNTDKSIIKRIKDAGHLIHQGTCRHRYPFCWRTDTPLIYRVMSSWFVSVEKIKDKIINANKQIYWMPEHLKERRFGKWLEGARDWSISRNRYWGTPIPIWRADDGETLVLGSIEEFEALTGNKITDLHRHFIDEIPIEKDGKVFNRIPEVFDCWFESGSMPYAQNHYPFENKELFKETFPADFIGEGIDQTRGWFYTLTVIAAALFDRPAFKNVIVNGIILAEDGTKMSKRLRNYPDPTEILNKYGADATRLYMLHSPVVRADDMRFTERGVELVMRQILLPLFNSHNFFITYARIYDWDPEQNLKQPENEIDKWILSKLYRLIAEVEKGMDAYDLHQSVEPFIGFIDELTNWYIRRSRRRFWEERACSDRDQAFSTLYRILKEFTKVVAPFIPFISESIYRSLRLDQEPESVHLCDYPSYEENLRNHSLEKGMAAVQLAVSLGHNLRKDKKIKVRQPLKIVHVVVASNDILTFLKEQEHLIKDELNVKEVIFYGDESQFVELKAKPNFRVLGKKVGKLMRKVQEQVSQFGSQELETLMLGKVLEIICEDQVIQLNNEDIEVTRSVREGLVAINQEYITIALDLNLTDELIMEGNAREVVNKIQTMRRAAKFDKTDRIEVTIDTSIVIKESVLQYAEYIQYEVLATDVIFTPVEEGTKWDINGETAMIAIKKVELVR